jgi:DNA processing protein
MREKTEAFFLLMNTVPVFNFETAKNILQQCQNADNFWKLKMEDIEHLYLTCEDKEKLRVKLNKTNLDGLVKKIKDTNCRVSLYSDPDFPVSLRKLKKPYMIIFYRGNLEALKNKHLISIVGTRKASLYGEKLVKNLVEDLSGDQCTVITGTAKGIDSYVIKYCLEYGVKCVSILASGINKISPTSSKSLLDQLTKNGGCYMTEFPFDVGAYRSNFPIRAKIIAALSEEIIIVEAPRTSGALHVAREAFSMSKNIFTFPSYFHDSNFYGSHDLIANGLAILVENYSNIQDYRQLY